MTYLFAEVRLHPAFRDRWKDGYTIGIISYTFGFPIEIT